MTDEVTLTWFPPSTVTGVSSVVFSGSTKFFLTGFDNFSSLPNKPLVTRGPFQPGTTLLDNLIEGKRLSIDAVVWGDDREDYWTQRNTLAHAFAVVPRFDQRLPEVGTLRIEREGQDAVEIECVPESAPIFAKGGPTFARTQIELFAPSPWWKSASIIVNFSGEPGGIDIPASGDLDDLHWTADDMVWGTDDLLWGLDAGLSIPETTGIDIPLSLTSVEIDNDGHVPTPLEITISGEVDTPKITLVETGEALQYDGVIAAGDSVRIKTDFGKKEVTSITSGVEANAFSSLNTSASDFFWLLRGFNTLEFSFDNNPSGSIVVTYNKRYAGV